MERAGIAFGDGSVELTEQDRRKSRSSPGLSRSRASSRLSDGVSRLEGVCGAQAAGTGDVAEGIMAEDTELGNRGSRGTTFERERIRPVVDAGAYACGEIPPWRGKKVQAQGELAEQRKSRERRDISPPVAGPSRCESSLERRQAQAARESLRPSQAEVRAPGQYIDIFAPQERWFAEPDGSAVEEEPRRGRSPPLEEVLSSPRQRISRLSSTSFLSEGIKRMGGDASPNASGIGLLDDVTGPPSRFDETNRQLEEARRTARHKKSTSFDLPPGNGPPTNDEAGQVLPKHRLTTPSKSALKKRAMTEPIPEEPRGIDLTDPLADRDTTRDRLRKKLSFEMSPVRSASDPLNGTSGNISPGSPGHTGPTPWKLARTYPPEILERIGSPPSLRERRPSVTERERQALTPHPSTSNIRIRRTSSTHKQPGTLGNRVREAVLSSPTYTDPTLPGNLQELTIPEITSGDEGPGPSTIIARPASRSERSASLHKRSPLPTAIAGTPLPHERQREQERQRRLSGPPLPPHTPRAYVDLTNRSAFPVAYTERATQIAPRTLNFDPGERSLMPWHLVPHRADGGENARPDDECGAGFWGNVRPPAETGVHGPWDFGLELREIGRGLGVEGDGAGVLRVRGVTPVCRQREMADGRMVVTQEPMVARGGGIEGARGRESPVLRRRSSSRRRGSFGTRTVAPTAALEVARPVAPVRRRSSSNRTRSHSRGIGRGASQQRAAPVTTRDPVSIMTGSRTPAADPVAVYDDTVRYPGNTTNEGRSQAASGPEDVYDNPWSSDETMAAENADKRNEDAGVESPIEYAVWTSFIPEDKTTLQLEPASPYPVFGNFARRIQDRFDSPGEYEEAAPPKDLSVPPTFAQFVEKLQDRLAQDGVGPASKPLVTRTEGRDLVAEQTKKLPVLGASEYQPLPDQTWTSLRTEADHVPVGRPAKRNKLQGSCREGVQAPS